MSTTIELDDTLIAETMAAMGQDSKQAAVEAALRKIIRLHNQESAGMRLAGLGWDGDLDAMREGRAS